MKRFLLKLAAFVLALLLPFGAVFAVVQSWPAVYAGSYMGSIREKTRTLDATQGPRIILLGGSNLPYAVECAPVAEAFGLPCVNMGATAYLGIYFYLDLVQDRLREGDIVVLAPEFSMYREEYSYKTVWMAVENNREMAATLPPGYLPGLAGSFLSYAAEKYSMLQNSGVPDRSERQQYLDFGYSPWGDITYYRSVELDAEESAAEALELGPELIRPQVLEAMNRFYARAQEKGARVLLTWAPYCRLAAAVPQPQQAAQAFEDRLRQECDIPLISSIQDCLLPLEYFYDSNNHLNSAGQQQRTQWLIEELRAAGVG